VQSALNSLYIVCFRLHTSKIVHHWSPFNYIFLKSVHIGSSLDGCEKPAMLLCDFMLISTKFWHFRLSELARD